MSDPAPELPPSTVAELLRARMAHLTTQLTRAQGAARRRFCAQERVKQEERFRDGVALEHARAVLANERKREDEAYDDLGRAFVAAERFVRERGLDA